MTFLNSVRPLLKGSASITITMSAAADNAIALLVTSRLETFDPETVDPARAALQAALALPMRVVIPAGADVDAEFISTITRYDNARAPVVDELQTLLDTLAQAQHAAKAEQAAKTEKAAKASQAKKADKNPAKKATATAATEDSDSECASDDEATGEGDAEASGGAASDATQLVSDKSPAPAPALALFD